MILLRQVTGRQDIVDVLTECGEALFDQKINDEIVIGNLAAKFFLHGVVLAAYKENKISGFISYYRNDDVTKVAFISMFAVMPSDRCFGIGSLLIGAMEEDCRKFGFKVIRLEVATANVNAISFYEKKGYREERRSSTSIFMTKAISV